MKTIEVFEKKMREANFVSLEAVRAVIKHHPLCADYVLDVLVDRGVLTVKEDGSVAGVEEGVTVSKLKTPGTWGSLWPDREVLVGILAGRALKFTEIQKALSSRGEPNGHWVVVHALRYLEKEGWLVRDGKRYALKEAGVEIEDVEDAAPIDVEAMRKRLVEAGVEIVPIDVETEEGRFDPYPIVTRALKQVGPPYDMCKVMELLVNWKDPKVDYGNMLEWPKNPKSWWLTVVDARRRDGEL